MTWLAELFETNRIIVLSVYGQVFFVLGLAVALQSRTRSELSLARPLSWLAAFGITHAFVEWGYLFIPLQAGFLPQPVIELLLVVQLLLKALSFSLLLQFGVELLLSARTPGATITPPRLPWLRLVPAAALILWAVGTASLSATVAAGYEPSSGPWLATAEIGQALAGVGAPLAVGDVLGRYMLALPGAIAVVIGLRRSAGALEGMARPPVGSALRVAAVAFGVYAVLGGMVAMPAPFPPSSLVSSATFAASGVPIEVLRSLTGLAIALAVIRSLDLFEQETDRVLAAARRRELLLRERERIGRDLHDGIIQSIYAAGLHLEEAQAAMAPAAHRSSQERIATVLEELNRVTADIRSYIFDLRSGEPATRDAREIVQAVAAELHANSLVSVRLAVDGTLPDLDAVAAGELHQIVTEALSNVLRHANARTVSIRLSTRDEELTLRIEDDGAGYDPGALDGGGQGLANMRRRAEQLGGRLETWGAPGRGARVSLTMPVTRTAAQAP